MGFFSRIAGWVSPSSTVQTRPQAMAGQPFSGLNDPALYEYMRSGGSSSRVSVSVNDALTNTAVSRSIDLVSGAMGMLPLYIKRKERDGKRSNAEDHPLFDVFQYEPNGWQTPFEFKRMMQARALVHGNAYAAIVRTGSRVVALNPITQPVTVKQAADWSVSYEITRPDGSKVVLPARDVFHLRDMTLDGLEGLSRLKQAAEIISLSIQSNRAAERIFRNGIMVGGALTHPGKLSDEAVARLRQSMEDRYAGAENAGKWMIFEEGMKAETFAATAADSQLAEMRASQVEEIARAFGVPRPLMGVDDTSWGTGIEQLAILFVRFSLAPWFVAWEEAIARSCIQRSERGTIYADFDETELLRGTLKDQAEFFSRALGAGGHKPWMEANEAREAFGLGSHPDGRGLVAAGELKNVAPQAPGR